MKTSFFFFFSARSVRRCWNRLSESLFLYLVVRKSSVPCLPRLVGLSLLAILNARAPLTEDYCERTTSEREKVQEDGSEGKTHTDERERERRKILSFL